MTEMRHRADRTRAWSLHRSTAAGRAQPALSRSSRVPVAARNVTFAGLPPSRSSVYELWLLGDRGELVSLGSVRVSASGRATLENVQLPVDGTASASWTSHASRPTARNPGHSSISVLRGPSA